MKYLFFITLYLISTLAFPKEQNIDEIKLKDQFEQNISINTETKYILFAKDKNSSEVISETLANIKRNFLEDKKIVYLADVSDIPSFVYSWFALPRMKDYPFRVALDEKGVYRKQFSHKSDMVSLIIIKKLKIRDTRYFNDSKKLKSALDKLN